MFVNHIYLLLPLVTVKWVQAAINMFQPNANHAVQGDSANGHVYYNNDTSFVATCGWQILLSSAQTLWRVQMHDAQSEQVDSNTFILTGNNDKARTTGLMSDVTVSGPFSYKFPNIFITWFCVCNDSTEQKCQPVNCETIAPNTDPRVARCTQVSEPGVTTPHPTVQLESLLALLNSTRCHKVLEREMDNCYSGYDYKALTNINHFIDCSYICCVYPLCEGVNFYRGASECDIIVVKIEVNSSLLKPKQDCVFWKVSSQN